MGLFQRKKKVCFCAFCKTPHRIYKKKGIGFLHFIGAFILAVCFMWGFWGTWNPQAIPVFIFMLFLSELLLHFRWRLALICRQCGFDPLIYQKNQMLAAEKVKVFLANRKTDPRFLLAPTIHWPYRRKAN